MCNTIGCATPSTRSVLAWRLRIHSRHWAAPYKDLADDEGPRKIPQQQVQPHESGSAGERFSDLATPSNRGAPTVSATSLDPASSVELARRIAAGEKEAETELVQRCSGALRFLCRRFARVEEDAEDLFQETLMLALEKIRNREVREPERLAGFLRALAKNLSTQNYRQRRYTAESPTDILAEAADVEQPDPLGTALVSERSTLTRQLLAALEMPRDRQVLLRYYLAEEKSSSICADLELDPDHFYRVLHRARKRYQRLWEERHPHPNRPPPAPSKSSQWTT